jgi:RND family efflux transporter MFP subunit
MRKHYPIQLTALLVLVLAPTLAAAAERPRDTLDCVISPHEIVEVSSAVPGLIEEVVVEHSDTVAAGQEVARLESGVEQASLQLAEAWASIESEVELERTNGALDQRRHQRIERLFQNQAVALDDRDRAETEVALSALRVRQAQEKRWIRRIDAIKARAALERRIVRSPIDGVVVERYRSAGEYVENQPILRIAKLDPLKVETILPMSRFGEVEPGMVAEVSLETESGTSLRAVVHLVDRMGDAASGTFSVRLTLPNPDGRIPAGVKCAMRFVPGARLPVPSSGPDEREPPDAEAAPPAPESPAREPDTPVEARPDTLELQLSVGLRTSSAGAAAAVTAAPPRQATPARDDRIAATGATTPCSVLGPLPDAEAAPALVDTVTAHGAIATLAQEVSVETARILVMKPLQPHPGGGVARAGDLPVPGLHDLQVMPARDHEGRVSGRNVRSADLEQAHRDTLAVFGLDAELVGQADPGERRWAHVPGDTTAGLPATASTACDAGPQRGTALVAGAPAY